MSARFYAPDAQAPGDIVALPTEEAEHLTRVLRLADGDPVRVFDGRGREFEAVVVGDRGRVRMRIGEPRIPVSEAPVSITLAAAVLKGDKMDGVVRDAVMLGATVIQPVVSARAETTLAAIERGRRHERWRRVAVASTKQCGRAVLPDVRVPCALEALLQGMTRKQAPSEALMFVEPGSDRAAIPLGELPPAPPRAATVVVGPEGGWTAEEIRQAAQVCRVLTMRMPTIRADAMAAVAIAALLAHWRLV